MKEALQPLSLEEAKKIQLDILDRVVHFCEENNILYGLYAGTLIGCIRHKGYIPWDDDIDLYMLRPYYERFLETFSSEFLSLHHYSNRKDYQLPFIKVDDTRTCQEENWYNKKARIGINIDIFPIDAYPDDPVARASKINTLHTLRDRIGALVGECRIQSQPFFSRAKIKFLIRHLLRFKLRKALNAAFCNSQPLVLKYNKKIDEVAKQDCNGDYKMVGNCIWGYGEKEPSLTDNFTKTTIGEFEGKWYRIPIGFHDYLSSVYGDYMQPPPEEERITHHHDYNYYKLVRTSK